MKWKGDKYKELKENIMNILVKGLPEEDASKISMKMAFDGIDNLFDRLIGKINDT